MKKEICEAKGCNKKVHSGWKHYKHWIALCKAHGDILGRKIFW